MYTITAVFHLNLGRSSFIYVTYIMNRTARSIPAVYSITVHLLQTEKDGSSRRAQITAVVEKFEGQLDSNPQRVKFKARIGDNNFEELIEYNDLMELIEEQKEFDKALGACTRF
jgi:hypothetical protein